MPEAGRAKAPTYAAPEAAVAGYIRRVRALPVLALAAAAALAAPARADDPPPEKLPPRVEEAARAAFAEAQAADQAGDLATAIERYRYAQSIAPHPNVSYNLADVLRRKGDPRGAVREYQAYLKARADAPDRAKVEKVIAQLEATPGSIEVGSKATDAIIFVDGVRRGPPPVALELPPGEHRVEAVTPISYRSTTQRVEYARRSSFHVTPPARVDGNLIVSGSGWLGRAKLQLDGADAKARVGDLFAAAPGKRKLEVVKDHCRWDKTVEPPHGDILYVYFDVPPTPPPAKLPPGPPPKVKPAPPPCGKAKVKVERITFPAP